MNIKWIIQDVVRSLLFEIEADPSKAPTFEIKDDPVETWNSLVFCIVSSQVSVVQAKRVVRRLSEEDCFTNRKGNPDAMYGRVLSTLQALGYRFPRTRAKQIVGSWSMFVRLRGDLHNYLRFFDSELEARNSLILQFPGLGFKQSSMFLRDIGYSKRLCVIDTHLLWYAAHTSGRRFTSVTPSKYVELEERILEDSDKLSVEPNILDAVIWAAVKSIKANKCMTLSA